MKSLLKTTRFPQAPRFPPRDDHLFKNLPTPKTTLHYTVPLLDYPRFFPDPYLTFKLGGVCESCLHLSHATIAASTTIHLLCIIGVFHNCTINSSLSHVPVFANFLCYSFCFASFISFSSSLSPCSSLSSRVFLLRPVNQEAIPSHWSQGQV